MSTAGWLIDWKKLKNIFFADLVRDLTDKTKKYDRADASKWFAKVRENEYFNEVHSFHLKKI